MSDDNLGSTRYETNLRPDTTGSAVVDAAVKSGSPIIQNLAIAVTDSEGKPISIRFEQGIPNSIDGPFLYLICDGSVAMGELEWIDGKQWLQTFNPAGMTRFSIAANKIVGWAKAMGFGPLLQ